MTMRGLNAPPKPVGHWVLPGGDSYNKVVFACYRRPRFLTRLLMRWLAEFKYEPAVEKEAVK